MNALLYIHVNCYETHEIHGDDCTIVQILFDGTADGPWFQGKILAGGVDTQRYDQEGGSLSARYTLSGVDYTGTPCLIYIENTAIAGEELTHPVICTDSKALSQWNQKKLVGQLQIIDGNVEITIGESDELQH